MTKDEARQAGFSDSEIVYLTRGRCICCGLSTSFAPGDDEGLFEDGCEYCYICIGRGHHEDHGASGERHNCRARWLTERGLSVVAAALSATMDSGEVLDPKSP